MSYNENTGATQFKVSMIFLYLSMQHTILDTGAQDEDVQKPFRFKIVLLDRNYISIYCIFTFKLVKQ